MKTAEMRLDPPCRREYATLIKDSGAPLFGVVNGIPDMSKIDAADFEIRPQPVRRAGVIGGSRDLVGLRLRETGLRAVGDVARELPDIMVEKLALKQILINRVSNAFTFGNRRGPVTVRAARDGKPLGALAVEDDGIAIGAASEAALFQAVSGARQLRPASRRSRTRRLDPQSAAEAQPKRSGSAKGCASRCASRPIASRQAPPLHHLKHRAAPARGDRPGGTQYEELVRKSA